MAMRHRGSPRRRHGRAWAAALCTLSLRCDLAAGWSLAGRARLRGSPEAAGPAASSTGLDGAEVPLEFVRHSLLCRVNLGDGQTVTALVDTGSGNLVVPSDVCSSAGCSGHRRFRPQEDPNGRFLGPSLSDISLSYASGHLGGSGFESRICFNQSCGRARLIVAAFESDDFQKYPFDAILGLGMPRQAVGEGFNLVDQFGSQGLLSSRSFALTLRADGGSSLSFAPSDGTLRAAGLSAANMSWFSVDSRHGEWAVAMQGLLVDGKPVDGPCSQPKGCRAVLDSGTAGIILPRHDALALQRKLSDLGDCSAAALDELPRLSFAFAGNQTFDVEPRQYVEVSTIDPSHCRLLIQAIDADGTMTRTAILGQAFLMNRVVVFNQSNMSVGLTASLPPPSNGGDADSDDSA